ncbi:MAG: hypothetical protein AAF679_04015 [Pseudomonadota bacterium]
MIRLLHIALYGGLASATAGKCVEVLDATALGWMTAGFYAALALCAWLERHGPPDGD